MHAVPSFLGLNRVQFAVVKPDNPGCVVLDVPAQEKEPEEIHREWHLARVDREDSAQHVSVDRLLADEEHSEVALGWSERRLVPVEGAEPAVVVDEDVVPEEIGVAHDELRRLTPYCGLQRLEAIQLIHDRGALWADGSVGQVKPQLVSDS